MRTGSWGLTRKTTVLLVTIGLCTLCIPTAAGHGKWRQKNKAQNEKEDIVKAVPNLYPLAPNPPHTSPCPLGNALADVVPPFTATVLHSLPQDRKRT